jgi:hypothetical protein
LALLLLLLLLLLPCSLAVAGFHIDVGHGDERGGEKNKMVYLSHTGKMSNSFGVAAGAPLLRIVMIVEATDGRNKWLKRLRT